MVGKGDKECLVFLGEDVIDWLFIYVKNVWFILVMKVLDYVFLSC